MTIVTVTPACGGRRYDDLGLHHPSKEGMHSYIRTPNLDQLVRQSTEFSNFYTTPMCTTTRAELLTGRYYPRTGSMYINSEQQEHGAAERGIILC
jgi:arylsulfatase A